VGVDEDNEDDENDEPVMTPARKYYNVHWSTAKPTSLAFTWEPYTGPGSDSCTSNDHSSICMRGKTPKLSSQLSSINN
jgi:hypothetical protein